MKRMLFPLAIVTAMTLVESGAAQPVSLKPENRVAVVDIGRVFTKYEKAKAFKLVMEKTLQPFKDKAEKLKPEITKMQADASDPNIDRFTKSKLEGAIIDAKRKLEDLDREARAVIGKKQEDHLVHLYKEVHAAVKEYADEHGILLVLAYGDPAGDVFTFVNINRKLTGMDAGSTVPLYVHASCDISERVVEVLNATVRQGRRSAWIDDARRSREAR